MKIYVSITFIILVLFLTKTNCHAESMSREEFDKAVHGSFSSDDGYYGTDTGDKVKFGKYICEHWSELLDSYAPNYNNNSKDNKTLTINVICYAAEDLPPIQYLDFLGKILDMGESGRFPLENASSLLDGRLKKYHFLEVNWQHPRVQAILKRAIKLFANDKAAAEAFEATAKGRLADTYRDGLSEGAPYPETLPGIKLQRPDASLIKKIELLTGKKVPYDPGYDPKSDRHGEIPVDLTTSEADHKVDSKALGLWLAIGGVISALALYLWRKRYKHQI